MKILLANAECKVGGVSTFLLSLRTALVSLGHRCELFFFRGGTMEPHLPADGRVHFGTLMDCLRLVQRERIDVVHANNSDWPTGISAVRDVGVKLILTAHKARNPAWTYGWTSGNCDAFAAVSHGIARDLQPFTDLRIQVVHNGIDTTRFRPADGPETSPPIVAWVGRGASRIKGLERFASIAPVLRRAGVRLWIVDQHGSRAVWESCPEVAAILQPCADFWGGVPYDEMSDLYRLVAASGGCVISTSIAEGLPLTMLEAQACACAVIGPDVRGVSETISPAHGGVLYPSWLPATDLADLVLTALADRERLRASGHEAAGYVRGQFSLGQMAERYLRIYNEAPYRATGSVRSRLRARLPLLQWRRYLDHNCGVGYEQYDVSRQLAEAHEWRLAAGALRASVRTSPTIYIRPQRLARLISVHARLTARAARIRHLTV
jgi:glycosyltransferase involved in cell wall biosynthesis